MPTRLKRYKEITVLKGFHAPIGELLNLRFVRAEEGYAELEMAIDHRHLNSEGVVQGGVLTVMADAAMGLAVGTTVETDSMFGTVSLDISFFRPVKEGEILKAEGTVINRTKSFAYARSTIINSAGKKVACASCVCYIKKKSKIPDNKKF